MSELFCNLTDSSSVRLIESSNPFTDKISFMTSRWFANNKIGNGWSGMAVLELIAQGCYRAWYLISIGFSRTLDIANNSSLNSREQLTLHCDCNYISAREIKPCFKWPHIHLIVWHCLDCHCYNFKDSIDHYFTWNQAAPIRVSYRPYFSNETVWRQIFIANF